MPKTSPSPAPVPGPAAGPAPVTFHMPLPASTQIQRIMRLLDKLPAPDALRLRDHFQSGTVLAALDEIDVLLRACPLGIAHRNEAVGRFNALVDEAERQQRAIYPAKTPVISWPSVPLRPSVSPAYAYNQSDWFPHGPGVCDTLCGIFMELRARGSQVKDILKIMDDTRHHAAIFALQTSSSVMQTHRGLGRALLETRWYGLVHAYCKAMWGGTTCPTLREAGCFPAGFSLYMDRGAKAFAVRLPDGGVMHSRTSPAPPVLAGTEMFALHQSLSLQSSLVEQLFRQARPSQGVQLFKITLIVPLVNALEKTDLDAHVIVVELTPGHRGIFDPNLGWMPITKGWNDALLTHLQYIGATNAAAGLIAYQYVPTTRPCHCKMPREAKGS